MPANAIILRAPPERDFAALIVGRILSLRDHLFDDDLTAHERGDLGIQIERWRERLVLSLMPKKAEPRKDATAHWPADIGGEA